MKGISWRKLLSSAFAMVLCCTLLLSSAVAQEGFGAMGQGGESAQAAEVAVGIGYDVATLAPWESATAGRLNILQTAYEYMAYYDSTQACGMRGILMESYEKVDVYTSRVKIYDYITDSAGNKLTAADVAFSFNTWKESGKSVKCKLLESATVVDEYTVDITLNADTVGDVENMLCGLVPIVTQKAFEDSDDGMYAHVVSTAPYVVTEFVTGDHVTLEKRDDYWQTDDSKRLPVSQANVDKITFKIITESAQSSINLETNAIDMFSVMAGSEVGRFEGNSNYNTFTVGASNIGWISFNLDPESGMFYDNLALRQAICYGIDTDAIIAGAFSGRATVPHAFANPECVDYNPAWDTRPYYEYDNAKAKELLAQSGFDTGKTIRLMYTAGSYNKTSATIIQSFLLGMGMKVELLGYEQALFQTYKSEPAEWDIILDEVQSVDFASSAASKFDNRNPAANFIQDDTLQALVEAVMTTEGHTAENLDAYMNYLSDECVVYAIQRMDNNYVAESTITSVFTNFKGWPVPGAFIYAADHVR